MTGEKLLSILIPSIPKRIDYLNNLLSILNVQVTEDIEILVDSRVDISIGKKRGEMLQASSGKFIVFIDDDDTVVHDYISLILDTIKLNSDIDCIGIQGIMTTNGKDKRQWYISKEYKGWYEKDKIYYRCQNHISPVLRDLAIKAGFDDLTYREDYFYSMRLLPLLQKEAIIPTNIYHYKYITVK